MSTFFYYNLSENNSFGISEGVSIRTDDLIALALANRALPDSFAGVSCKLKSSDIDPLGIKNPKKWEDYMMLLVWVISGKEATRQEILRGRQILLSLPSWFKKSVDMKQVSFGLLPYLLIGFKSHLEDRFLSDSNKVSDVSEFVLSLYSTPGQVFESFLCAHREKDTIKKFCLVEDVYHSRAFIALNLSKALLVNNPWGVSYKINWFQQGATESACLNMFPEMFLRYLSSGEIPELLQKLNTHQNQINDLMVEGLDGVNSSLNGSDARSNAVLSFLSDRYGVSWKSLDFSSPNFEDDHLVQIALADALSGVLRLTPFYSNHTLYRECLEMKKCYVLLNLNKAEEINSSFSKDLICSVIEKFYETQEMHPTAKALYEVTFYYLWGLQAATNSIFSVGIDRDHSEFQYKAWNHGFNLISKVKESARYSSLIYARRGIEGKNTSLLKDFSVRQFWR
jgi:hypothetical protein